MRSLKGLHPVVDAGTDSQERVRRIAALMALSLGFDALERRFLLLQREAFGWVSVQLV